MTKNESLPRPVIFGEVLFDCFESGETVLGGAPFNVAWHLKGLGLEPYFISRVGKDDLAEEIIGAMRHWGMDRAGLQRDPEHPTGTVQVKLRDGQPSFEIVEERAYDYIGTDNPPPPSAALLYHGSLIQRGAVSAAALACLKKTGMPVFVDINLRPPWWHLEHIAAALHDARWLKLNREELMELAPLLAVQGRTPEEAAHALRQKYALETLIVTRGGEGAFVVDEKEQIHSVKPSGSVKIVDTVGAGDAFSAFIIAALLYKHPIQAFLQSAQHFAEAVCGIRGAVSREADFYTAHRTILARDA